MLTVYSDRHRLHHGHAELIDGEMKPCFEMPSRADFILERVRETKLGDVIAPASFGLDPVHRVHDKGFIAFLGSASCLRPSARHSSHALPRNAMMPLS